MDRVQTSLRDAEASHSTVKQAIQLAISRLGLDAAPVEAAPSNAFFKHAPQLSSFRIPPLEPYINELAENQGSPLPAE